MSDDSYVRVKFKYRRQNEDELNLSKGQIVKIIFKHDDGWWEGKNLDTGETGYVVFKLPFPIF